MVLILKRQDVESVLQMADNMDYNAGAIADGAKTLEEAAEELWGLVLDVANGRLTRAEVLGHREFGIRRIAPTL